MNLKLFLMNSLGGVLESTTRYDNFLFGGEAWRGIEIGSIWACRCVQGGSLMKHEKFGAKWSKYDEVLRT